MSILGNIVGKSASVVGDVLNSALPGSGMVLSGLLSLFGVKHEADLPQAIKNDPESALKLKQFELTHLVELEKIVAQDRNSARDREKSIVASIGKKDWTISVLAMLFVGGFFAYAFMFFFVSVEPNEHDIVMFLAGQISSIAMMVAAYYFGGMFRQPKGQSEIILPPPEQTR